METNLRHSARRFHPHTRPLPKVRVVAQALRVSDATAEKKLYGDHSTAVETARIIEALLRLGDTESVATVMAPIDAALFGREVPHYTVVEHEDDTLDALEDAEQAEWRKTRSDPALDDYIKKLAHAIYKANEHLAALKAERQRRREARS